MFQGVKSFTAAFGFLALSGACSIAAAADLRVAIYVVRRDGSGLRKVVQVPEHHEHSTPSWSHDGKRLAFDAIHRRTNTKKLFVVNIDGTGLEEIGDGETPDWSPDDKQLAVSCGGVCVQNADGKGRVRIADGRGPRWSPDGGKLAFTDGRNLIVLDLLSGASRDLIDEPVQDVQSGAAWSPDGERLAVIVRRNGRRELLLVDTEGAPNAKVRLRQNIDGRLAWSPDGKRIAMSSNRMLYTLEPDGRGTQMIPGQKGVGVEPAWSPDGQWIAFSGHHP